MRWVLSDYLIDDLSSTRESQPLAKSKNKKSNYQVQEIWRNAAFSLDDCIFKNFTRTRANPCNYIAPEKIHHESKVKYKIKILQALCLFRLEYMYLFIISHKLKYY